MKNTSFAIFCCVDSVNKSNPSNSNSNCLCEETNYSLAPPQVGFSRIKVSNLGKKLRKSKQDDQPRSRSAECKQMATLHVFLACQTEVQLPFVGHLDVKRATGPSQLRDVKL